MRYAVKSDIHANEPALRSVLVDAHDAGADEIVSLGDVLGYGPDPVEALETLYREAHVCLAGNHDDAVAGRISTEDFTEFAASAVERHRGKLSRTALEWLRRLPHTCECSGFACVHGDFVDPKSYGYILSAEDAAASFKVRSEALLFAGHTHEPCVFAMTPSGEVEKREAKDFVLADGERYIVNPGSVGYPRHGACRSSYCIYDDAEKRVSFRSLPFDIESYRKKMQGKGMDEAPWLGRKANEARRVAVRSDAKFAKREKASRPKTAKKISRLPVGARTEDKAETPLAVRLVPALVVSAILLSAAGLYCTFRLTRETGVPSPDAKIVQVAGRAPEIPAGGNFVSSVPLSGEWTAFYEKPQSQKVRIERNEKSDETAFRIEHREKCAIRFVKRMRLVSKPEKIYTNVRLLSKVKSGEKDDFGFSGRIVFFDGKGNAVGEDAFAGKRSSKRAVSVPDEAEEAQFVLDCRCKGVCDLAVPYFSAERERTKKKKRNLKQ